MTHGRIETTPEQQLAELRVAYTRYTALAEQWRDDSLTDPDERQARELDARRIAHAYEKTIASTALRLESMHRTHAAALGFTPLAKTLSVMLGIAVVSSGAAVAYLRPELFRDVLPRGPVVAANAPAAALRPQATPQVAPVAKPVIAPKPAITQAAKPVIAPSVKLATAPAKAKPAPLPKQAAPQQAAAKPAPAKPAAAKSASAPAKVEARAPVKAETRVSAVPRVSVTPQVTAASPQAKVEPLSPPKDVLPLPVPPKGDAPGITVATPPKSAETAAAAPQTVAPQTATLQTATAQASASTQAISGAQTAKLVPVMRTHMLPPYPTDAKRAGEQGTTQMQVSISTEGVITDCKVITSSGSQRLDATACSFVQRNWRWQPPTRDGREVPATTKVSVIWNLIAGR